MAATAPKATVAGTAAEKPRLRAVKNTPIAKATAARTFTPVYDDVLALPTLKHGPKNMYSRIVRYQGDEEDGRRGGAKPIFVSQKTLKDDLGATLDEIGAWGKKLAERHPCQWCNWQHALLKIRRVGKRRFNEYTIVKCRDVAPHERAPIEPKQKRQVVRPQDRDRANQTSLLDEIERQEDPGTWSDSEKVRITDTRPPSNPRHLVLRGIALLHGLDISDDVLEAIAEDDENDGAGELESALFRVLSEANLNGIATPSISRDFALATLRGDSEKVRITIAGDEAGPLESAAQAILKLARRREPNTTFGKARQLAQRIFNRCLQHEGSIEDATATMTRILSDRRVVGRDGRLPANPIALLRLGVDEGWLFIPEEQDDGSAALAKAFARLAPGHQETIADLIRRHIAGEQLDYARLRAHGVSSRAMIAYLKRRFAR